MIKLVIEEAVGVSARFRIGQDSFWFHDTTEKMPIVEYPNNGGKIHTHNIDEWLQHQTDRRYSLHELRDMIQAFVSGRDSAYSLDDLVECGKVAFDKAKEELFENGLASAYIRIFDIECGQNGINIAIPSMRSRIEHIKKVGPHMNTDELVNYISRCIRICYMQDHGDVAEAWIKILESFGLELQESRFQNTDELDKRVLKHVEREIRRRYGKSCAPRVVHGAV